MSKIVIVQNRRSVNDIIGLKSQKGLCAVFPGDGGQIWQRTEISTAAATKGLGGSSIPIRLEMIVLVMNVRRGN